MNQIEVQIMGQSYLLGCPTDGETQLRDAVARVDAAMCGIRDSGRVKARDRIAVLASLNLAYDLIQREQDLLAAQAAQAEAEAALAAVPPPQAAQAPEAPTVHEADNETHSTLAAVEAAPEASAATEHPQVAEQPVEHAAEALDSEAPPNTTAPDESARMTAQAGAAADTDNASSAAPEAPTEPSSSSAAHPPAAAPAPKRGPLLSYSSAITQTADSRTEDLLRKLDQALTSDGRLL